MNERDSCVKTIIPKVQLLIFNRGIETLSLKPMLNLFLLHHLYFSRERIFGMRSDFFLWIWRNELNGVNWGGGLKRVL